MTNTQKLIQTQRKFIKFLLKLCEDLLRIFLAHLSFKTKKDIKKYEKAIAKLEAKIISEETIKK